MKRLQIAFALLFAISMGADAQGFLKKLKDKVKEKVENKIENKVDKVVDSEVDDLLGDGKKSETKKANQQDVDDHWGSEPKEDAPTAATSSDFKRGSVVMFQDDVTAEQVGEFPSKWDLIEGSAEVKTLGGKKAIEVTNGGIITPLIKEKGAYLPEEFTIEYDFYYWNRREDIGLNDIKLCLANKDDRSANPLSPSDNAFTLKHIVCDGSDHGYDYNNGSWGETKSGGFDYKFTQGWHHVALSFNKRALKVYFDGNRVVNLPRVQQPTWFCFEVPGDYHDLTFIRNVVLAKGAVALYDRNAQSMTAVEKAIAETGKFVTNNILFKTGKADLLPESMAEIQKVADYMKKNPTARFEVQGHTDNQGSDKINDPLSQQRAESVVKALESLGVDAFNLRAVGKGSHEPVADNKTEAGRAQNRRVEFIKK